MINVEGYKAFRGVMKITPIIKEIEPYEVYGDWLYKPDFNCWYGNGRSYPANICEVIKED